jgi:uncharacterized protein (UPF0332 family)
MRVDDFFNICEYLYKQSSSDPLLEEIFLRTAINRLYYGLFHFVQRRLGIAVPSDQTDRCHKFVKEAIEETPILNDYTRIEELRVRSDYETSASLREPEYKDAMRLKDRIIAGLEGVTEAPLDDDAEFFTHVRNTRL